MSTCKNQSCFPSKTWYKCFHPPLVSAHDAPVYACCLCKRRLSTPLNSQTKTLCLGLLRRSAPKNEPTSQLHCMQNLVTTCRKRLAFVGRPRQLTSEYWGQLLLLMKHSFSASLYKWFPYSFNDEDVICRILFHHSLSLSVGEHLWSTWRTSHLV